ncbi:MAG: hypothetical protein ABFD79_00255 [Phycisphaerales bacterium]
MTEINKIKVGILPGLADLYNRLFNQEVLAELRTFIASIPDAIGAEGIEFEVGNLSSTEEQMKLETARLTAKGVDMIVILLAPYCPSGAVVPAIMESNIPVLLWPAQTMYELVPGTLNGSQIRLSHGVHGVQDIANVLRRHGKKYGILHGHHLEDCFRGTFEEWAKAARIYTAFITSNPIQLGGHFEDMLDLQIADAQFIADCGIKMTAYDLSQLEKAMKQVNSIEIKTLVKKYKDEFAIASDVSDEMLEATARGECAVRALMKKANSQACGINFLTLCNTLSIGDAMHVPASRLMTEGKGYAGEGDWVTAAFVYALQSALGAASFSEIFSVDYKNGRILLNHWGEANLLMAENKAKIFKSAFNDRHKANFCAVDMQFSPGPATLINLNADPQGQGQLISLYGNVLEDYLSKISGPRALFKPDCPDIHKVLNDYAYNGGSHHLTIVKGCATSIIEKLAILTGWSHLSL